MLEVYLYLIQRINRKHVCAYLYVSWLKLVDWFYNYINVAKFDIATQLVLNILSLSS